MTRPNLRDFIDGRCAARGGAEFLRFRGRTWSYADLARITDGAASAFARLGLRRGDRAALLLPNGPEAVFCWLALAKLGVVTAPLHPQITAAEAARALARVDPKILLHDPRLPDRPVAPPPGCPIVLESGPAIDALLAETGALAGVDPPAPDDVADLLMTSGTTGLPKGALQTHRAWVLTGEAFARWLDLGPSDRLFTCLPLSHVNARAYSTLGALAAGASLAIEERFSASRFWAWLAEARATEVNAIGAMLMVLLKAPPSPADRAHRVRIVYSAPALGETAHLEFEQRFGVRLVIGYGLTESTFGFIHPLRGERRLHSMGRPRSHPDPAFGNEVRLVDATGREADEGEIWLRNAAVFAGYFGDEEATRDAIGPDGWLRTGDLARREHGGWYTFVARRKEIIRRRGENVAPAEVEAVLLEHEAVREAAVIGVPSELGEEEVAAFVVLDPDAAGRLGAAGATGAADPAACEAALRAWAAARLAAYKVPTVWRFLDALPRTPTQRVARHLLRLS